MEPDTDNLTIIHQETDGMLNRIVYANDPQGNTWRCVDYGQGATVWKLHRSHEDIVYPTPSVQQVLDAAENNSNQNKGTVRFI